MSESPKNIIALIAALENFQNSNRNFKTDDRDLFDESRDVFQRLKRLSDFDPDNLKKIIDILNDLPPEIKELDISEIGLEGKEMDSKALNKEDLKELIEDYEKAQDKEIKEELHEEIVKRTGKRNVDQFIKTQKEIAAKNAEKLKQLSPELREKVTQDLAKISDEDHEAMAIVLEKATLDEKYNKKELEKEIKKIVKDEGEKEKLIKKVEEIRAEIKVESKAEEIAQKTYEKLREEGLPVSDEGKTKLKSEILKSWRNNEELEIPSEIAEKDSGETIVRETQVAAENFKSENLKAIVNYRAIEFEKEASWDLRNKGVRDEGLIDDYVSVVKELTINPETARTEINSSMVVTETQAYFDAKGTKPLLSPTVATEEAETIANFVVTAPNKFNRLRENYNIAREGLEKIGIGVDKLPKIKEARVVEKLMNQFNKYPQVLRMMNVAQRTVNFIQKVDAFPGSVLAKIGVQNAGLQILGKIGGQASVELVKNATIVLAEQGTAQGIKSIASAIFTKGAVIAGEAGGATAGALTGVVAAFQALPVVGQVIAVVVIVIAAGVAIVKPFIDGIKKIIGKLGINPDGVKNFLSDSLGLGNFLGGVGQFVFDVGTFLIGIPGILGLISFTAIITPVVVCFFLGIFTYSLFQQNLVSSLVPPEPIGDSNCVLKDTPESGGDINCNQNAPENSVSGVSKSNFVRVAGQWTPGKNYSEECYNDTVNRALCAGVNPAYALWAWVHESGASNYSIKDVEDFGIHGQSAAPPKNYNAQITAFLKLDPGTACPNLDYWLSFATNYLTGGCDPDVKIASTGESGRDYLKQIQEQWSWVSSNPMPANIKVPKGGKNCGSIGGLNNLPGGANEVVDSEGRVWICTPNTQSPGDDSDPNAPGLDGVIVDGECSVGDVVVPTKQCDPQWGSVQLNGENCSNGKPGTICSAGCGPTSVSMMLRHVNGSLTPKNVIFGSGSAYYDMGCGGSSLSQAEIELRKKFGNGVKYDAVTQGCDEKAIAKWICDGKVVMILADFYRNSSLGLGGHFVLGIGVKNGKIVVADPYYSQTNTPFDGTKAFGYAHEIRGCLTVEKSAIK